MSCIFLELACGLLDLHSYTSGTEYSFSLHCSWFFELHHSVVFQSTKQPSASCEGQEYEVDCNKVALFQNVLFLLALNLAAAAKGKGS